MSQEPIHRGILGLDIERFSRTEWTDPMRARARSRLHHLVDLHAAPAARGRAGDREAAIHHRDAAAQAAEALGMRRLADQAHAVKPA